MTLPNERLNSLENVREFLFDLINSKETPKVPLDIRRRARYLLKHYPSGYHLEELKKQDKRRILK